MKPDRLLVRLWFDECGMAFSTDVILVATIVGIAMIVGLQTIRDAVIQEIGDMAVALEHLDQSYNMTINGTVSQYSDTIDVTSACIGVCLAPVGEGDGTGANLPE